MLSPAKKCRGKGRTSFYRRLINAVQDIGLLDDGYMIYRDKHTGAINLYLAIKGIEVMSRHCRHANPSQTADYLRKIEILQHEE